MSHIIDTTKKEEAQFGNAFSFEGRRTAEHRQTIQSEP